MFLQFGPSTINSIMYAVTTHLFWHVVVVCQ